LISIIVTKEQLERAENLYEFGVLNNSIMQGGSNIYGAIGEVIVSDYFKSIGKDVVGENTRDYDMIIDNKKVDVKTKKVSNLNTEYVLASLPSFNTTQKCDFYFFCQVKSDKSRCWILGYKSKEDYYKEAFFRKKGDIDEDGFVFKADCYNMKVYDLNKFKDAEI